MACAATGVNSCYITGRYDPRRYRGRSLSSACRVRNIDLRGWSFLIAIHILTLGVIVRLLQLRIHHFRGIKNGSFDFSEHTILIGTNSAGKSTMVDVLSLLFGREAMVRDLTEHDFYGSNPGPADRFRIIAALGGFEANDPAANEQWFREGRGVPKWWSASARSVSPQQSSADMQLCVEIGYAARFDRETLSVEKLRYFHDDDDVIDPFDDDAVVSFPQRLLAEIGFFVVPASRARERILSFTSEIFRRVVAAQDAFPAEEVLRRKRWPAITFETD